MLTTQTMATVNTQKARVTRHLREASGLHWHYRQAGRDLRKQRATLVLLHPSPRSSAMYEPWLTELGQQRHVLAVDTPGYGGSDALPRTAAHMNDYAMPLRELLLAAAGERFVIYGSATGAQLAIAYANLYPGDVVHLVLDNAAHFDEDSRRAILQRYFPDLTPASDGSHLRAMWQMCSQMGEFFPWFEANETHRVSSNRLTAEQVHAAVSELMAAGPRYDAAYRCAFEHERASNVQRLSVPTSLLRWQGSVLLKHIDRLLQHELPAHVRTVHIPAAPEARFAALMEHLQGLP
jgi:pimeloyl-ACP methyl ester carboxylesterase